MSGTSTGARERLALAANLSTEKLAEDSFAETVARLGVYGNPASAFDLLSQVSADPASGEELRRMCTSADTGSEPNMVERTLLVLASRQAADRVPQLPISERVKDLFADEFTFFANPSAAWLPHFQHDNVRYREMVRIATLRRFPAGQFHWEIAGFPRSWVLKANHRLKLMRAIVGMGGFSPLFELHLNSRRKNRLILLEKEANLSYYRAAKSMEAQPEVRGIMLTSWLFCESTAKISPHLAWLRQGPQSAGAVLVDLGPAAPDSGFLTGSEERRKLYDEGKYRPQSTCVLWPRAALLRWAQKHPEMDK